MAGEPGIKTELDASFFHIAAMHDALQQLQFAKGLASRREAAAAAEALARKMGRRLAEQ